MAPDRRRTGLAVVVLSLVVSHTGPAATQPAPADALPSVVYPFRLPDPGQRVPEPVPAIVEAPPIQYVLIDGVWGYLDRHRHFHPGAAATAIGPEPRSATIPGGLAADPTPVAATGPSVRRYAVSLPNPSPGAIVVRPSSQRDRSPAH